MEEGPAGSKEDQENEWRYTTSGDETNADPLESTRDTGDKRLQGLNGVTLAKMPNSGVRELEES